MFPLNYIFQYNPNNLNIFSYTFPLDGLIIPGIILGILSLY